MDGGPGRAGSGPAGSGTASALLPEVASQRTRRHHSARCEGPHWRGAQHPVYGLGAALYHFGVVGYQVRNLAQIVCQHFHACTRSTRCYKTRTPVGVRASHYRTNRAMISYLNRTAGRRALAMPTLRRVAHPKSCDEPVSKEDTMIAMRKVLCLVTAVACLLGAGAWAQVQTSELHVLVKDVKGAVVSGATITAAEAGK